MNVDVVLDALSDRTRRQVFDRLRRGPLSVGELADGMAVSRPAVSQHLKVLKAARLVADRAEGTKRIYTIEPRGLDPVRKWLDGVWDEALARFQAAAEREAKRETKAKGANR